jgi:hypothetical protein
VAYHDEYNAAKANDPESMASWLQIAKESAVQKKETKSLVKVGTSAATEMTKIWNKWDLEVRKHDLYHSC